MFVQRARTLRSTLAPNIGLKKLKDMVFHALLSSHVRLLLGHICEEYAKHQIGTKGVAHGRS